MEVFTTLLARHLDTFRKLESLQVKALDGMKNQGVEGLAGLLASQQEVLLTIAREKAELKPHLDQWELLQPAHRALLRQGRPGEILDALEAVAQGIQARHQDWFGEDPGAAPAQKKGQASGADAQGGAGDGKGKDEPPPDLSQTINIYRSLQ